MHMHIELTPGIALLLATAPIGLGLGWYAWRCRSLPGALILAAVAPLATLWALTSIGEVSASTLERKLVWANIQYVAITLLPVGLLALSIDYSGRRPWLSPKHILPLCLVPMVTLVLLWTDPLHHLMRSTVWLDTTGAYATVGRTFGPWFWFHSAYSYALIAAALGITLATTMSTPYFYRRQPLALLVGIIIPSTWNAAFIFAPSVMPAFDFTPVAILVGGLFAAWGILQIRVFNLVPVARHTLVEDMADGVLVLDETDRVVDLNRSAQKLIGRPRTSILSRRIGECWDAWTQMAAPHAAQANQADLSLADDGRRRHYEVKWSPLIRHDRVVGRVVAFRDVTERVLMEENLRRQTLTDSLTGLPNRTLFMTRLEEAIHMARRRADAIFAVMVLDLDWFKVVNDSIGHHAGDALLRSVADKLKRCVREVDTVARMSGDEFMILLNSISGVRDVLPILERIREELRVPVYFRRQEITTTCSVGVVLWDHTYDDPEDLLRAADTAMYQAKKAGRDCHRIFDEEMHISVMRTLKAENDLRAAIRQNRFSLAYQPIVDLRTGTVCSLEALIRWHHSERGTIFPDEFIATAEESGLIVPLGEMALREVCDQMSRWRSGSSPAVHLPVSLNVSPRQLAEPEFAEAVAKRLDEWRISTNHLILEVTETAFVREPLKSKTAMQALHDMGVRLCLDDFGTGWSSLQHLTTFPVQQLKIDQAFISKMAPGNTFFEVVRSLVSLAQTLGLEVIAEGIESTEQWLLLQELGCDCGQGYFIADPMGPAEITAYLEDMERGSCFLPQTPKRYDTQKPTDPARRAPDIHTPAWRPQVSLAVERTP